MTPDFIFVVPFGTYLKNDDDIGNLTGIRLMLMLNVIKFFCN